MYEFIIRTQSCTCLAYCKATSPCVCISLCFSAGREKLLALCPSPSVLWYRVGQLVQHLNAYLFLTRQSLKCMTVFRGNGDPGTICSRLAWQLFRSRSDTCYQ